MGFSIYATVCIGAVLESMDDIEDIEDSIPKGYELDLAGSSYDPEVICVLSFTKSSTYWDTLELKPITSTAEKTKLLTNMLDSINIKYSKAGLLLYQYYSH